MKRGAKAERGVGTLSYLKPYSGTVAWGLIIKIIATMAELSLPLILKYIIEEVVPLKSVEKMAIAGAIMLAASITALVCNVVANRLAAKSAGSMTRDLRYDLFKKTTYLKSGQVDAFTLPSLISRLTSDTYYVNTAVARTLRLGVRAPILLAGGLVFTFIMDWRLALILLACIPFVTVGVALITKKSVPMYTEVQKCGDKSVRAMQENITGVRVIKALSKTDFEADKYAAVNAELTKTEFATNRISALTNPLTTLILNLGLVGIIAAGALMSASAGVILAFLSYFVLILNAMLGVSKIFVILSKGVASAARISEVLSVDESMPLLAAEEGDRQNKICFEGVSFSYNGRENNLEDVSFAVKAGQTVGVIGGTGSGKTTLINLLMRFYDAGGGAVYVDGKNVQSFNAGELRAKFGAAFQNDFLIASSVRDNIDYFRNLPQEDIERAAYCACADGFIEGLEGGYDFELAQKGANLSGGQKQRLLIARALAANPDILVLDDSSSALDYSTDALFRKRLSENYAGCTKFIVAQRVSAVKHADLIVVMDDGRVVGSGTHEELLKTCVDYQEIYTVQMGGDL